MTEDKYKDKRKEYGRTYRERKKRIKMGIIKPSLKDYHMAQIELPAPRPDDGIPKFEISLNIRSKVDEVIERAQKEIRREWGKTNSNYIIIVDAGPVKNQKSLKYNCQIHQLRMNEEKIQEFEKVCKTTIETINNNYLKEKQNEEVD